MTNELKGDPAVEDALGALNNQLRKELVESGIWSTAEWNEKLAPYLKSIVSAMLRSPVHPRTFRLHPSVVNAPKDVPPQCCMPNESAIEGFCYYAELRGELYRCFDRCDRESK